MMNNILSTLILTAALSPALALACEGAAEKHVQTVSTVEGAQLVKEKSATFVDVNGAQTRAKEGVIPGAILLSSTAFEASELPAEKATKLVFYCASTQCGASKMAAKKAVSDGYANVFVLPEGIKGWKQAGNPTAPAKAGKSQS